MTEINEVAVHLSEAQELLDKAVQQGDEIENLCMAFSLKNKPLTVVVGTTGRSPTMWVLGALDHIRWHIFNAMTMHKYVSQEEVAEAITISDFLKKEGRLN